LPTAGLETARETVRARPERDRKNLLEAAPAPRVEARRDRGVRWRTMKPRPGSIRASLLAAAEARVGELLAGTWHVDRMVAAGGMAAVFAATDRDGAAVAIKMLFPHFAASPSVRARFLREGYVANTILHPGVVTLVADGRADDGSPFLVMELLDGESMETWLKRAGGKLSVADVLAVADQTLAVLEAAHAKGIIHRDLKPTNLFVTTPGLLKVLDFGLARLAERGAMGPPTAAGMVLGTSAYMPPEQAMGKQNLIDARSDLFAVGAVMFRALAGRHVREQLRGDERLLAAMVEQAPSLSRALPDAPGELVRIVDRALAFEQSARWPNAAAMRAAVRAAYAALAADGTPSAIALQSFGDRSA
jgi:eukaryotic-like serine/threonine-protein kinase